MFAAEPFRAWVPIAAVLSALACSPTEPSDLVDARLVLDEAVVQSGAASTGRVEVTNRGREAVTIEVVTCPPRVFLFDRRGTALGQPPAACPLALTAPVTIAPGETHTLVQGWIARNADGVALPSGTYLVQAWVAVVGDDREVRTNRATAEVRQDEPAPAP